MSGLPTDRLCDVAIAAAEQRNSTSSHLLAAIGQIESGRRNPITGVQHPWPWTVNAEGKGGFYDTKQEAVAAVRGMQARGVESIDVGCMQVNLMHHPDAFASLELAFDPQANALYAGRFLRQLFARTNDWRKAAALYHSATPELGAEYQLKVMAIWPDQRNSVRGTPLSALARAWAATLTVTPPEFGHRTAYGRLGPVEMTDAATWSSALRSR
jgi:Transglycosylase SLT domain